MPHPHHSNLPHRPPPRSQLGDAPPARILYRKFYYQKLGSEGGESELISLDHTFACLVKCRAAGERVIGWRYGMAPGRRLQEEDTMINRLIGESMSI